MKFHSRNGLSRLDQYETHNSRSNSRSDSRNCREPTRKIFICPCILGAFFQELGWSPRTRNFPQRTTSEGIRTNPPLPGRTSYLESEEPAQKKYADPRKPPIQTIIVCTNNLRNLLLLDVKGQRGEFVQTTPKFVCKLFHLRGWVLDGFPFMTCSYLSGTSATPPLSCYRVKLYPIALGFPGIAPYRTIPPIQSPIALTFCLHAKQNKGGGYRTSSCPLKGIAL